MLTSEEAPRERDEQAQASCCTPSPSRLRRTLLLVGGSLCLAIGIMGIVVPLLPTTPFLILAAVCYARSSPRCYSWLVSNRVFGRYLDDYLCGRGVSWRARATALLFIWAAITASVVLFVDALWLRVLLVVIALAVTVHVVTLKGMGRSRRSDVQVPGDE